MEVLAGAGHSPHMEAANEVNRLVGGFLDVPAEADAERPGPLGEALGVGALGPAVEQRLCEAPQRIAGENGARWTAARSGAPTRASTCSGCWATGRNSTWV